MSFLSLVAQRQSVRKYSNRPVEAEKLGRCLEAARLAPSASNSQPWHFIIVDKEPLRTEVAKATFSGSVKFNKFALQAPVLVVLVMTKPRLLNRFAMILKKKEWRLIDVGITAEHFCLQAAEEGLGSCMMGWYDEKQLRKLLNIPSDKTVSLVISLGYAEEGYPTRKKSENQLKKFPVTIHSDDFQIVSFKLKTVIVVHSKNYIHLHHSTTHIQHKLR
ncbi:MAG: nitroreductase family protein [Bacteroidales bacterium]|nr:nitroreductase family protein [Bacteroidales bacterium]